MSNGTERADAARNRAALLVAARRMIDHAGVDKVTMDALAERAEVGKGTVFRRFGTRAGIFLALLADEERAFQERVRSGPSPLGPGAPALERLLAFGPARLAFLAENREIARAAFDGRAAVPSGPPAFASRSHIEGLLVLLGVEREEAVVLAMQLTAALDVPLLLYEGEGEGLGGVDSLSAGWGRLIRRLFT